MSYAIGMLSLPETLVSGRRDRGTNSSTVSTNILSSSGTSLDSYKVLSSSIHWFLESKVRNNFRSSFRVWGVVIGIQLSQSFFSVFFPRIYSIVVRGGLDSLTDWSPIRELTTRFPLLVRSGTGKSSHSIACTNSDLNVVSTEGPSRPTCPDRSINCKTSI